MASSLVRPVASVATWNSVNFVDRGLLEGRRVPGSRLLLGASAQKSRLPRLAAAAQDSSVQIPLPTTAEEMNAQAAAAIAEAYADGHSRVEVEFLLPVNQRSGPGNFLATEAMDYPCNITTEFMAAAKCSKEAMEQALGTPVKVSKFDNGGDPIGLGYPEDGTKGKAAIIFPIAEVLPRIRSLTEENEDLVLMCNAQWLAAKRGGSSYNLFSDFGIGPWKRRAEEFLDTFTCAYSLEEVRVGSILPKESMIESAFGAVVRLLYVYGLGWHVYVMQGSGVVTLMCMLEERPSYSELEALLQAKNLSTTYELLDIQSQSGNKGLPMKTPADVDGMDKTEVRSYLSALGLSTAGKLVTIKSRLRDALENLPEDK
mmetsp:Transcript_13202/g.48115  ORF Transcript_13202/g.48115 Transcript_13202/m.48115 type:complete len:371 (+) Transcript_13202:71-1183(+)